jgi:hypothetical protein
MVIQIDLTELNGDSMENIIKTDQMLFKQTCIAIKHDQNLSKADGHIDQT